MFASDVASYDRFVNERRDFRDLQGALRAWEIAIIVILAALLLVGLFTAFGVNLREIRAGCASAHPLINGDSECRPA
jgi:hypothetical protein